MQFNLSNQLKQLNIKHRRKNKWRSVMMTLSAITVFCTVYMLILPALTVADKTVCGFTEHIHTNSCYTEESHLSCEKEQTDGHTHSNSCYVEKEIIVCGKTECDAHTHSDTCYDNNGNLVCTLDETQGHKHLDECRSVEHILTCSKQEHQAHYHTDDCYMVEKTLVCDEEEHIHNATCYNININKDAVSSRCKSEIAMLGAASSSDTIPSDDEYDRFYSNVNMYYEYSPYELDYKDTTTNRNSSTSVTTFALVPVKEQTYTWTPYPASGWTSEGESNYDVAYCADINVYTSGDGDVYYDSMPISEANNFTNEQKTRLTAIVQNAYPFISYEQVISDIKTAGYSLSNGCSLGELITGTQWAIWEIVNNAEIYGSNSSITWHLTGNVKNQTIHPLTDYRSYSSTVKSDIQTIHDYLISRTAYTKNTLTISSKEIVDIKSNDDGTYSVTIKVSLNRQLTEDESVYVTVSDSDSNTLTSTVPYNTTSFEVTLDNVSENVEYISVDINGSSSKSYLSPIFYDSPSYQDMLSAKILTPTYYDSVRLRFSTKASVKVNKKWVGGTGADSIEVTLYANGEKYAEPVVLNSDNNWSYEWKNLPRGSLIDKINYSIKETPVAGYYTDITSRSQEKETTTQSWIQASSLEDGKTYMLLSSNGAVATQNNSYGYVEWLSTDSSTVNTEQYSAMWIAEQTSNGFILRNKQSGNNLALIYSNRSYKFFEKVSSANRYTEELNFSNNKLSAYYGNSNYYLTSISGGYGSSSTNSNSGTSFTLYELNEEKHTEFEQNFTITNTKAEKLTSVEVNKVWKDSDGNTLAETPDSVNVSLYANGEQYGEPVTLNNENSWSYIWTDLPEVDTNNTPVKYNVKEAAVEGFESSIEEKTSDISTIQTKWKSSSALEDGKTYLFVSNGQALSKTDADNEYLEFKDVDVTNVENTNGLSMWTATKSGDGFKLVNTAKTDRTLALYSYTMWWNTTRRFVAANNSSSNISTRELNYSNGYITASGYKFDSISGGYGSASSNSGISFELYELAEETITESKTEVVITNTKVSQTLDIRIKKVDSKQPEKVLSNAVFDLYRDTGVETDTLIPNTTDKYGVRVNEAIVTDTNGFISVEGLTENVAYYLVETQAPNGYNLLNIPIEFKISDGRISVENTEMSNDISENNELILLVKNEIGYTLPETGGSGKSLVTFGGLLLVSVAILLMCKKLFRKKGVSF